MIKITTFHCLFDPLAVAINISYLTGQEVQIEKCKKKKDLSECLLDLTAGIIRLIIRLNKKSTILEVYFEFCTLQFLPC